MKRHILIMMLIFNAGFPQHVDQVLIKTTFIDPSIASMYDLSLTDGLCNMPRVQTMEVFLEAFFAIDTDNSEEITMEELEKYMEKNDFEEDFIQKWMRIFDVDGNGVITLEEFCSALGLQPKKARQYRSQSLQSAPVKRLPTDVEQIASDMSMDNMLDVIDIVREAKRLHPTEKDWAKYIKQSLDMKFDRLWHTVIIMGQYWIHYSHEPGYSFHFKIGRHIFLIWRTPGM